MVIDEKGWVGLNLNPHPLKAEGAAPKGRFALDAFERWLSLNPAIEGPGDLGVALVGEVGDVAGAGGGDAGFDGGVGFFAGADAVEEIFHVGDGAVAETFGFDDGIEVALDAFAPDGEAAARDFQGGVGAAEFEAAVVDG